MTKIHIPHDAIVFVGDGRKALFLRNEGDEKYPNLKTERVFLDHNPPTHEQGTDRPGRSFSSVGHGRSAVEQTDWHDLEEHHFARVVAEALEKLVRERHVKALLIAAPPRTLAVCVRRCTRTSRPASLRRSTRISRISRSTRSRSTSRGRRFRRCVSLPFKTPKTGRDRNVSALQKLILIIQ
jgi:protein required for attachment to host cells